MRGESGRLSLPRGLPRVKLALRSNGAVGQVNPGALAELLGDALLVFADAGLFFLEDDGHGWGRGKELVMVFW